MRPISIQKVDKKTWDEHFAASAHLGVFDESIGELDDIDFALIGIIDGKAAGYSTAKHLGFGHLFLNYGGAFDFARGTPETIALYKLAIAEYLKVSSYLRTHVKNTNLNYLTLALREGFLITGIRFFKGDTLLELTLDREG